MKILRKKAQWKAFDPRTRKLSASLLVSSLYCLILALACGVAALNDVPATEIFQSLSLCSTMAWVMLTLLSLMSNLGGAAISRAERYRRMNPALQKQMKGFSVIRMPVLRIISCRAGHGRAHRSQSHAASSNASKDSSDDGESDPDSQNPPPLPLPLVVLPSLTFSGSFGKLNNFLSPRRRWYGLGCCLMFFTPLSTGRGWEK